jgi:hypothetical protein
MKAYERTIAKLYELSLSNFDFSGITPDDYIEALKPLRLTASEKAEIYQAFKDFFSIITSDSDADYAR